MVVLKAETVLKAGTVFKCLHLKMLFIFNIVFKCLHLKMSFIITVPAFKPSFRDHTSSLIECLICYSIALLGFEGVGLFFLLYFL